MSQAKQCQRTRAGYAIRMAPIDFTISAISCAADFRDSALESFQIARDVLQWKNRPRPKSSATVEVDYDGDDNTIISGWTEVESVVVVRQRSSRTYVSSDSSSSSPPVRKTSSKRRGRSRNRSTS